MIGQRLLAGTALIGMLAFGSATPSVADAFIAHTRPGNFTFAGAVQIRLPLNLQNAQQTQAFANAFNQRFIVTYTAECAVNAAAGNNSAWVDLDIVAINQATFVETVLPPTAGAADAFCDANGTAGFDGWKMHTANAIGVGLPAGVYRVQVRARLNAGATGGWISDSSLIIWR